jgi:general secretion pathway protein A
MLRVSPLTAAETLECILAELQPNGGANELGLDVATLTESLSNRLEFHCQAAHQSIVFVDAANDLPESDLESLLRALRVVGNKLPLTSILVGSPEMLIRTRRLDERGVPPISRCVLSSMAPSDTSLYIRHRMLKAGGDPTIFSEPAIELIHDISGGLPRRINRLCDLCLLVGYAKNCDPITPSLVWVAQGEIRLLGPTRTPLDSPTRRWRPLRKRSTPLFSLS